MSHIDVICLGEAMIELSLTDDATDTARIGFAGDTLNTAVYLKRTAPALGVGYATKLGSDRLSDRMVAMMEEERLDTSLVLRDPNRAPGLYAITTDTDGERSFQYWRDKSAARAMFEDPGLTFPALACTKLLYFSAITLAILPDAARAAFLKWLPIFRAGGGIVAFDSNYRERLWQNTTTAKTAVADAWRQTDIGLPSVDDEMALFGDVSENEVRSRLNGWGVTDGALKRGAKGPIALDGSVAPLCPSAERVVDSTAAGDSFNGGYLGARLDGMSPLDALLAGHRLAALVVQHRGAIVDKSNLGEFA